MGRTNSITMNTKFNLEAFGTLAKNDMLTLARIAEQAERYEDMCAILKNLIEQSADLSVEERNLLSVAYKNVVGSRRASWRAINSEAVPESDPELLGKYRGLVEEELSSICQEVIDLLQNHLVPSVKGKADESEVFY